MSVLTRRELIERCAERWKRQYYVPGVGWKYTDRNTQDTYERLVKAQDTGVRGQGSEGINPKSQSLNPVPDAETINRIVGNNSWTRLQCDACGEDKEAIYRFDLTHGQTTSYICAECLASALNALKAAVTSPEAS